MAFQMVRSFFGQRSPSRSLVHEPIIESESFGNQGGIAHYDTRDVGKSANSNWFELARHDKEASESGRKPHSQHRLLCTALYYSYSKYVRLSLSHSPVWCQNDSSYDHSFFTVTGGEPRDSSFFVVNIQWWDHNTERAPNERGVGKIWNFESISRHISETAQDSPLACALVFVIFISRRVLDWLLVW